MRANLIILAVLCGVIALATFTKANQPSEVVATDFAYEDINGKKGHLYDFSQPVVLHFWATWCRPCLEELPTLISKANEISDTTFLLISVDQNKEAIHHFLKPYAMNKNIVVIHDPAMTITDHQFTIRQFPETILLSADKKVRRHIIGTADWSRITTTP